MRLRSIENSGRSVMDKAVPREIREPRRGSVTGSTPNRWADFARCMVNEGLKAFQSGTCLRAIKRPFTKRITTAGVVDSTPRKAVSDLLRFPSAIVAGGVNDFGVDRMVVRVPIGSGPDRSRER